MVTSCVSLKQQAIHTLNPVLEFSFVVSRTKRGRSSLKSRDFNVTLFKPQPTACFAMVRRALFGIQSLSSPSKASPFRRFWRKSLPSSAQFNLSLFLSLFLPPYKLYLLQFESTFLISFRNRAFNVPMRCYPISGVFLSPSSDSPFLFVRHVVALRGVLA